MAQAVKKKLVVCGGNGFLGLQPTSSNGSEWQLLTSTGNRICKAAVARGWDVTSVRYEFQGVMERNERN
jgi:hypothetical protein